MRFRKILRAPTSTNHSLNARSPLVNDERSFAVRAEAVGRVTSECDVWPERIQQLIRSRVRVPSLPSTLHQCITRSEYFLGEQRQTTDWVQLY
jgi:hypothetical protein